MSIRVRFAPSPTGPLHIGGVRTALYNYLFAKKNGGTFILRIEDTDQNRLVKGAEAYITKTLDWLGISPDEGPHTAGNYGPYRQSERKEGYLNHAQKLANNNNAYLAFDTATELQRLRETEEKKGGRFVYNWENRAGLKNSLSLSPEEVSALIAKKTLIASISGGSPVVFALFTTSSTFEPFLKISTLNFFGISFIAGIL